MSWLISWGSHKLHDRPEFEHIQRLDGGVLLMSDVTVYEPSIQYRCLY